MKLKTLLVSALVISLAACETEDDDSNDGTNGGDNGGDFAKTCYVDGYERSGTDDQNQPYSYERKFLYNPTMALVEIEKVDGGGQKYGSALVYRNDDGTIKKIIEEDSQGDPSGDSLLYTYSGGNLSTIEEFEDDNGTPSKVTYTFTTSGGNITAFEHDGGDGPNIENATYTSGNITSGSFYFFDNGTKISIDFEATYDDKQNVMKHFPNEGENAIEVLNKNNIKLVTATSPVPFFINIGDTILYRTYSYNADGGVTQMVDHKSKMNDNASTTDFTVTCQ